MTLLTRWDPLRDMATLQNRINRFVRESYSPEGPEEALTTTTFAPRWTSLRRRAHHYSADGGPGDRRKRH